MTVEVQSLHETEMFNNPDRLISPSFQCGIPNRENC